MGIVRGGAHTSKSAAADQVSLVDGVGSFTYILRYPDTYKAQKMADCMIAACNNDNILYSQDKRYTLYNAVKGNNYNPSVAKSTVYCDCSSLIQLCCLYAGIKCPDITTSVQRSVLKSLGFSELPISNSVKPGDILWRTGHTEMIVSSSGDAANMGGGLSGSYTGGAYSDNSSDSNLIGSFMSGINTLTSSLSNIVLNRSVSKYTANFEERSIEVVKDIIKSVDANNIKNGGYTSLLSYPSLIEVPFIQLRVGGYTFGKYTKEVNGSSVKVDFPNYIDDMTIKKINGQLNQYTIRLSYQITTGDDPNLLDKIFSSVGFGKVYITYGDYASPTFMYKEEEAILTKVSSNVDFNNSKINYTVECTSSALLLAANTFDFEKRFAKPSDVMFELLYNSKYGLTDVFTGMKNKTTVINNNLIATDDVPVEILAKPSTDPLTYLQYLVTCMSSNTNKKDSILKDSTYRMALFDDNFGSLNLNGPYFKVTKISSSAKILANSDVYEVDIGYPTDNQVMNFSVNSDNSWNLLYNYSDSISTPKYTYDIDNNGNIVTTYSPNYATNKNINSMTESQKTWWTNMTQFPISATLSLKGLVRPTILMTYIRINSLFFGEKHDTSGLYIITGQTDSISGSGYRTTLNLTRIAGDTDYIEKTKQTITSQVLTGYSRTTETITVGDVFSKAISGINNSASKLLNSFNYNSYGDFSDTSGSMMNSEIYSNGNGHEDIIWNTLMRLIGNKYGVAGLMGNIKYESGLKANCVEGQCLNAIKQNGGPNYGNAYTDAANQKYTADVNNRKISRAEFLVPLLKYGNPPSSKYSTGRHYGYGLVQWTTDSRKGGLYDFMMGRGAGIDDPAGQAEYIVKELTTSYSSVLSALKSASNIDSATEIVYNKYESPGSSDTSLNTRKKYAKEIYNKYAG